MGEIKRLIEEILARGYVMSLGTVDEGGVWVADVIYIYDTSFNIFWISQISTRHSQAIEKNNHIAGTITTSVVGGKNEGLQIEGTVERVNRPSLEMIAAHFHKRLGEVPHTMYLNENDELSEPEISWYRLKPIKIELFYEKHYGFNKQVIELK